MRNKIIAVTAAVCMIFGTASARVVTDDETSAITVSGTVESGETDVSVGIEVFCPGMDADDFKNLSPAEYAKVVAQFGQAISGEDGKWEYTFNISRGYKLYSNNSRSRWLCNWRGKDRRTVQYVIWKQHICYRD